MVPEELGPQEEGPEDAGGEGLVEEAVAEPVVQHRGGALQEVPPLRHAPKELAVQRHRVEEVHRQPAGDEAAQLGLATRPPC